MTTIEDRLQRAEAAFLALVELGDASGHPFRGNQWTNVGSDHQPMGGIQGNEQLHDGIWREQLKYERPETDSERKVREKSQLEWERSHPPTDTEIKEVVDAVTSSVVELGEGAGHPFRGNQHVQVDSTGVRHSESRELKSKIGNIELMRDRPIAQLAALRHEYMVQHGGDLRNFDYNHISRDDAVTRELGNDYKNAPRVDDSPETREAYEQFRDQTAEQWQLLTAEPPDGAGIRVDVSKDDPYPEPGTEGFDHMMADLNEGHMGVLEITGKDGEQAHPFLTNKEYTEFRAVHDAFGHAASGRGFDRHGEEAAWVGHKAMYTGTADRALTTETRGANAYLTSQHEFPPYKMALMPEKFDNATTTDVTAAAAPMVQWGSKYEHVCCSGGHVNVPVTYRPDTGRTGRETLMASSWIEFDADGDLRIVELGDSPGHPFRGNQYNVVKSWQGEPLGTDLLQARADKLVFGKESDQGIGVKDHDATYERIYGENASANLTDDARILLSAVEHGERSDVELYRGIVTPTEPHYTEGQTVSMSLGSFSEDRGWAESFADPGRTKLDDGSSVTFVLEPGARTLPLDRQENAMLLGGLPNEHEHITGGTFEVTSVDHGVGDSQVVGLKQTDTTHTSAPDPRLSGSAVERSNAVAAGTLEERVIALEAAVVTIFGDSPGHPFHGNQHTGGGSVEPAGFRPTKSHTDDEVRAEQRAHFDKVNRLYGEKGKDDPEYKQAKAAKDRFDKQLRARAVAIDKAEGNISKPSALDKSVQANERTANARKRAGF